ncbi:hypothetical protein [Ureaplasma zalophigenitalium]|uniref:Uncharacterized protein n=1 Tax=Ureaplasma zalophigenitalium TaxID=907723 RepID=A0ABT3BPZ7_9BACT|nr:hypothetical protein [Ureaplasma zalophigenitalium]MCV3754297.1 hypothetical protein [Ureaplasma zalophigenitalium]
MSSLTKRSKLNAEYYHGYKLYANMSSAANAIILRASTLGKKIFNYSELKIDYFHESLFDPYQPTTYTHELITYISTHNDQLDQETKNLLQELNSLHQHYDVNPIFSEQKLFDETQKTESEWLQFSNQYILIEHVDNLEKKELASIKDLKVQVSKKNWLEILVYVLISIVIIISVILMIVLYKHI